MVYHTPEGKAHLEWCLERALIEYDAGSVTNAIASVISDLRKDPTTQKLNSLAALRVIGPAAEEGREALKKAVMGFAA